MSDESLLWLFRDVRRALKEGAPHIAARQRMRFAATVAFARANSPYFRDAYKHIPDGAVDLAAFPVTTKTELMAQFNDWVTDRSVRINAVRAFIDRVENVGAPFLETYRVTTTSGTTGTPGIFLVDPRTFKVAAALMTRALRQWLGARDWIRIALGGSRMSMIMATGGHYASAVAAARLERSSRARRRVQVLSADLRLEEVVDRLNVFQPALIAPYASVAALLAGEQEAGRLQIKPALLALAAEGLPLPEYGRIARAFDAKVGNSYAATECPFLSYSCAHNWLHVNEDWVIVEPVDADHQPVAAGTESHTVLITNLANRVQPILRYELGDSVLVRPDRCPCGNPLTAIRVQGRAADVVRFARADGTEVAIPPLALQVADVPGVEVLQIVQVDAATLRVRFVAGPGGNSDDVWQLLSAALGRILQNHHLHHVRVERAQEVPQQAPSGKYRAVIPLGAGA